MKPVKVFKVNHAATKPDCGIATCFECNAPGNTGPNVPDSRRRETALPRHGRPKHRSRKKERRRRERGCGSSGGKSIVESQCFVAISR